MFSTFKAFKTLGLTLLLAMASLPAFGGDMFSTEGQGEELCAAKNFEYGNSKEADTMNRVVNKHRESLISKAIANARQQLQMECEAQKGVLFRVLPMNFEAMAASANCFSTHFPKSKIETSFPGCYYVTCILREPVKASCEHAQRTKAYYSPENQGNKTALR